MACDRPWAVRDHSQETAALCSLPADTCTAAPVTDTRPLTHRDLHVRPDAPLTGRPKPPAEALALTLRRPHKCVCTQSLTVISSGCVTTCTIKKLGDNASRARHCKSITGCGYGHRHVTGTLACGSGCGSTCVRACVPECRGLPVLSACELTTCDAFMSALIGTKVGCLTK